MQRELAKSRITAAIQAFRDGLIVASGRSPRPACTIATLFVHPRAPGRVREEVVVVPADARRVLLENHGRWARWGVIFNPLSALCRLFVRLAECVSKLPTVLPCLHVRAVKELERKTRARVDCGQLAHARVRIRRDLTASYPGAWLLAIMVLKAVMSYLIAGSIAARIVTCRPQRWSFGCAGLSLR